MYMIYRININVKMYLSKKYTYTYIVEVRYRSEDVPVSKVSHHIVDTRIYSSPRINGLAHVLAVIQLVHWGLLTSYGIMAICQMWFRQWLVVCPASSRYMNQCYFELFSIISYRIKRSVNQHTKNYQEIVFLYIVWKMPAILLMAQFT